MASREDAAVSSLKLKGNLSIFQFRAVSCRGADNIPVCVSWCAVHVFLAMRYISHCLAS